MKVRAVVPPQLLMIKHARGIDGLNAEKINKKMPPLNMTLTITINEITCKMMKEKHMYMHNDVMEA